MTLSMNGAELVSALVAAEEVRAEKKTQTTRGSTGPQEPAQKEPSSGQCAEDEVPVAPYVPALDVLPV